MPFSTYTQVYTVVDEFQVLKMIPQIITTEEPVEISDDTDESQEEQMIPRLPAKLYVRSGRSQISRIEKTGTSIAH